MTCMGIGGAQLHYRSRGEKREKGLAVHLTSDSEMLAHSQPCPPEGGALETSHYTREELPLVGSPRTRHVLSTSRAPLHMMQ